MMQPILLLLLLAPLEPLEGARILGVFPLFARSHHRMFQPLMRALAEAGHEVVVYSPFALADPPATYTDVLLANVQTESEQLTKFFQEIAAEPHWKCLDLGWKIWELGYDEMMEDNRTKQLISSGEQFDLVITEAPTVQEYTLIFGHIFKAPVISVQAFFTNNIVNDYFGNDLSTSYIPETCFPLSNKMSLFERIFNTFSIMRGLFYTYNAHFGNVERRLRERFHDFPPIREMIKNISLIFVNDHLTADYARPRPPNIIPVAGIHIQPPQPLPQNLKTFMDAAKDGVIFFSLGTYVADELQPKSYFDMYNNIFKKLKQRVLWKTRKENVEGLPENVMTVKWAPQPDILAHPNCELFITHGGLLSQHEAVHFGVPVVGIPQFFDQHRNVRFYEEQGVGVKVSIGEVSETTMTDAINTVLGNTSYKENMKRLSAIFRDRPLSPAESVVFWTEYVLRHGGAAHLRPASTELRWYQLTHLVQLQGEHEEVVRYIQGPAAVSCGVCRVLDGVRVETRRSCTPEAGLH